MKRRTLLFFVSLTLILAAACSKGGAPVDDGSTGGGGYIYNATDSTAPTLDIYTPVAGQVFATGNVINVTGRIADDYGLYRGTVRITNDANGAVMKEQQYEIHGILAYNFTVSYTTVVSVPAEYTVTINFEDHGNNAVSKQVKIKVNP